MLHYNKKRIINHNVREAVWFYGIISFKIKQLPLDTFYEIKIFCLTHFLNNKLLSTLYIPRNLIYYNHIKTQVAPFIDV